jgi:predicted negative regulator of RcsB-dependent stress response
MPKLPSRRKGLLDNPEEVLTLAQRLGARIKQYWHWLALAVALVVVVSLAWSIHAGMTARREAGASEAFFQVRSQVAKGEPTAEGIKTLDKFLKEYPGTAAARQAELLRADSLYKTGKYAEAAKAYESLEGRDPALDLVIKDSLSYCYEAMGDYQKAAGLLKPLAEQTTGPFKGEFQRHLAMLYQEAKEPQEAAVYWRKLMEESPNPQLKPYLEEKVARAEAQIKK